MSAARLATFHASFRIERALSLARQTELGVPGWPVWKDAEGERTLNAEASEKSYFMAGRATLTLENGDQVTVQAGDLVVIPAGGCHWHVHETVRRHYRSDALSPACCIV